MNYKQLIVESGKRMAGSGLTVETWGNISFRDKETGLVYLTPSAMLYDTIVEDDVVVEEDDEEEEVEEGEEVEEEEEEQ